MIKKWLNFIIPAALAVSPLAIVASCNNNETTDEPVEEEKPEQPVVNLDLNTRIKRQKRILQFNNRVDQILNSNVKRTINNQFYETSITRKYKEAFKYPSWNYNYEEKPNGRDNRYQQIGNENVDGMELVYNERTDWKNSKGQTVKFSDPEFILDQIKNKQLKVHPAAKVWFEEQIPNDLPAVTKGFSIGGNFKGPNALGLYVAPGEIATIKFSKKTLELMKAQKINDVKISLNGSFWDNYPSDDSGRISNRYPFVMTDFTLKVDDLIANNGEFQFGSPFGGTIDFVIGTKLKHPQSNPFYPSYRNFEFQISGALETLTYVHGKTTKADWDAQIEKIREGKIQAPAMALDFAYGTMYFQSTAPKTFARVAYENIIYPESIVNRWNDFLFLSNLFASRDLNDSALKIHFRFNDDIYKGGAAWGGNGQFKAPLNEGANAFLKGDQQWTIPGQWLIFHEINHNFQQDQVLFKKQSHKETNQVSMFDLSLLSDEGRFKNPYNWTGNFSSKKGPGWSRVQSGFASNRWMQVNNYTASDSEYEIQNLILQMVGTYNFLDYVQNDAANHPNTMNGWNGFEEIVQLSKFFKLNFWPAMQKFSTWWNDSWPTTYEGATTEQKKVIDELNKTYKAFDYVANVFAVGNYLWDEQSQSYIYTNDMQAPIDISATGNYIFDFEKGINSANKNFKWDQLSYQAKTKLGGTLAPDPKNGKILIYTPPKGHEGEIDEFDMAIHPDYKDVNDKANYVDQYGFKIKMFLNPRGPVVSLYNEPLTDNKDTFSQDELTYMSNDQNISFRTVSNPARGILYDQLRYDEKDWPKGEWQRMKISFDFVAPKAGTYQLQYQGDARVFVTKDYNQSQVWFDGSNHVASRDPYTIDQAFSLAANESVHFDFYISANPEKTRFKINAIHLPSDEIYDVYQYSTVGNLTINDADALYEDHYQYHHREIDLNRFQSKLFGNRTPNQSFTINKTDEANNELYTIKSIEFPKEDVNNKLANQDGSIFEKWGKKDGSPFSLSFEVDFQKPQTIGAIIVGHTTNKYAQARPTSITVKDQDDVILYDGPYGTQFNDRHLEKSITNFDHIATNVTKLKISFTNTVIVGNNQSALIFDSFSFTNQRKITLNKIVPVLDPAINYYGDDWKALTNDPDTIVSDVNFSSIQTTTNNHYLRFKLFANGFDVIGQQLPQGGEFDLYINDKLIGTYSTNTNQRNDNALLATYQVDQAQWLNVSIVNRSNKLLRLNYFQTYGEHVEWLPYSN